MAGCLMGNMLDVRSVQRHWKAVAGMEAREERRQERRREAKPQRGAANGAPETDRCARSSAHRSL
jgi:hypothetical protein